MQFQSQHLRRVTYSLYFSVVNQLRKHLHIRGGKGRAHSLPENVGQLQKSEAYSIYPSVYKELQITVSTRSQRSYVSYGTDPAQHLRTQTSLCNIPRDAALGKREHRSEE